MPNKALPYLKTALLLAVIGALVVLAFWGAPPLWRSFQFSSRDNCIGVEPPINPPLCMAGSFQGFSFTVVLFLLGNYILIALFGYVLFRPFLSQNFVKPLLAFVSSFFLGYVALIGIIRVLSLVVIYKAIYWPVMCIQLAVVLPFLFRPSQIRRRVNAIRQVFNRQEALANSAWLLTLAVFLISVLCLQVRQESYVWNGHGTNQYAYILELWRQNSPTHFPVLVKHYDEMIFHYFLTMPLKPEFDPIIPWWITLAFIKTSMWAFMYLVFRKIRVTSFLALVFTAFLFFGTSSLVPTKYYLIFDSANFLYFTVHAGRMVWFGIFLLLITHVLFSDSRDRLSRGALFLAGLGLAATSVSNAIWVVLFYPWLLLSVAYYRKLRTGTAEGGLC
jgi:hypothetical protein